MSIGYSQKTKKVFKKMLIKGIKTFLMERKTKNENIIARNIKVLLKKKKTKVRV